MTLAAASPCRAPRRRAPRLSSRRGLTLVETLLAIAVGAAVLIGSVLLYVSATGHSKVNEGFSELQAVISGTRSLYAGQADYASLTNAVAGGARVFPPQMIRGSDAAQSNPVDPWGGAVTVEAYASDATQMSVEFDAVPQDACAAMAASNTSSLGGAVQTVSVDGAALTLPITPDVAVQACNSAANTIVWTVR